MLRFTTQGAMKTQSRFTSLATRKPQTLTVLSRLKSSARPLYEEEEENDWYQEPPVQVQPTFQKEASSNSPKAIQYAGQKVIPIVDTLRLITPQDDVPSGVWPVFRLMDETGQFRDPHHRSTAFHNPPEFGNLDDFRSHLMQEYPVQAKEISKSGLLQETVFPFDDSTTNPLLRAHRQLVRLREMDSILLHTQRQGRISFYMTCTGEEAIHFGASSALDSQDHIFAQYREQGPLMWRGWTMQQFTDQCFGNDRDLGKGRQMPIHYGSRALNYHTVSSPLGTQLPQAVGAAYRLKQLGQENVVMAFFGDGASSTTDFHTALNFAATLKSPVIFFCRNNGYAISTPTSEQFVGDGVVARAPGYGMAAIRVDGNDIFAVHAAVREARKYALEQQEPVLIEAMTYRLGHHSTSDDSTAYRSQDEIDEFSLSMDPLDRLNRFLEHYGYTDENKLEGMKKEARADILEAIQQAEGRAKPALETMFDDVYKEVPPHLQEQLSGLKQHLSKYADKY